MLLELRLVGVDERTFGIRDQVLNDERSSPNTPQGMTRCQPLNDRDLLGSQAQEIAQGVGLVGRLAIDDPGFRIGELRGR